MSVPYRGPVFPDFKADHCGGAANTTFSPVGGLSLRDYFAGQALAGLMLREAYTSPGNRAGVAYEFADAMLAEREKSR